MVWTQRNFNFFPPQICQFGIFKISNNLLILNFQNVRIIWVFLNVTFQIFKIPQKLPILNFQNVRIIWFLKCHFQIFKIPPKLPVFNFQNVRIIWFLNVIFRFSNSPQNCQFWEFSKCQNYVWFANLVFSKFEFENLRIF